MANKYCNLVGSKKISEDFNSINVGFDKVQQDIDAKSSGDHRHTNATDAQDGYMSKEDKAKLNSVRQGAEVNQNSFSRVNNIDAQGKMGTLNIKGGIGITVTTNSTAKEVTVAADNSMARKSEVSEVQNALNTHKADAAAHITPEERRKLSSIQQGAEVNQNAFSNVNNMQAGAKTDTLNIKGGTGITITTNPNAKEVTITATGEAAPGKHGSSHKENGSDPIPHATLTEGGLMSKEDKAKLYAIEAGAKVNVIETVKVNGTSLRVTDRAVDIPVPAIVNNLTSTSTSSALSATQGKALKELIDDHINDNINSDSGIHGFRYFNDVLQFSDGKGGWIEIETGGGGVAPGNVSNASIKVGNGILTIKWSDPGDTVVEGQTISTWAGTKLVRKAGSFPANLRDGVVLVDNKIKNAYATTGFIDSGLTNDTTYYYQLFTYNDSGAVNKNTVNRLSAAPQAFKIFGVRIDLTNSNPETAVTYTDDAVGMTTGSTDWDSMEIFKNIKPGMLKNGVVQYYLNPNDFTKKADGSAADIASGNDGDVMIEIPKTGYSITTNGNYIDVKVTDNPNSSVFKYYAHTRAVEGDRQKLYVGAYKGYVSNSKLRSLSGKQPAVELTLGAFRILARASGSGYDMLSFYPLTLMQCLYLIKYKNLDSQTALGQGFFNGFVNQLTGTTDANGMCYGSTSTSSRVKLFGVEDFWGNTSEWIEGVCTDSSTDIKTAFQSFNDTGSGYTSRGRGATPSLLGFMSKPQGTSEMGFIPKNTAGGSGTTFFTDYTHLYPSYMARFGGSWGGAHSAGGVFCFGVFWGASEKSPKNGARLMYL